MAQATRFVLEEDVMIRSLAFIILCSCVAAAAQTKDKHEGIRLLEGYSWAQTGPEVDALALTIYGKSGFTINFETGPSEGSWANPKDQAKYSWYREQKFKRYSVRYALIKSGRKTQWEPKESRGLPPGNILLVTFIFDKKRPDDTANFVAKIANTSELADALLIVQSYDPTQR